MMKTFLKILFVFSILSIAGCSTGRYNSRIEANYCGLTVKVETSCYK